MLQELEARLETRTAELEHLVQELTEQRKLFERQTAELIEERRRRMAAFRTLGQLVHSRSVSRLTRLLAESATELTRARGACLTLRVKKRSTLLEVKGASGIATELVGIRFPAEGSVAALAMRTGKPQLVAAAETHPTFAEFTKRTEIGRILVTTITDSSNEPLGAFLVLDPHDASEEAIATLSTLASQAGIGLESLRRAAAARRINTQTRLLAASLNRMRAAIIIADAEGRIRYANRAAATLYGYEHPSGLAGHTVDELYTQMLSLTTQQEIRTRAWDRSGWNGEVLQQQRDGGLVPARLSKIAIRHDGRILGSVLVARDTRTEKRDQIKLLESDRLALVGGLVASVAHEINNSLGAIGNFAELMLSSPLNEENREFAETIAREAFRAGEIVRNLLCFARQGENVRDFVSLNEIVNRTLALRVYDQRRNRINVIRSVPDDLPLIWANANQIQQVLLNLIVNAEQAIGSDGSIMIRGRRSGSMVELVVEDTGPGIPPDILPQIFTPFFSTKPIGVGTGLGLPIVKQIVEEHGGTVEALNRDEGGARFRILLPRKKNGN